MGFDGILTSVFIPLEISPDTNLMKKHSEQWRLDVMPGVTERRETSSLWFFLEGGISTVPSVACRYPLV